MSFIINPLSYRLTKTKFSKFNWVNISKYNYKKLYFEDKILEKVTLWFNFFFNWIGFNISILNFNVLKFYKFIQLNIKILIRRKNFFFLKNFLKKKKKKFLYLNKKFLKNYIFFKYFFLYKKKYLNKKIKKINKYFLFLLKKRRKKKKYIKNFILNYFFFKKIKKSNILNNFIINNIYTNFSFVTKLKMKKKYFLKYLFFFFKSFLIFFFNNIFYNNKIIINFLNQNEFYSSSNYLSNFIKMRISQKYRVLHIIGLLFNNLLKKTSIIGLEIGLFGRYQKKLRNRKIWKVKGMISPSNINSPISYKNFIILLRYGICGVKIYLLMKVYKNEIF